MNLRLWSEQLFVILHREFLERISYRMTLLLGLVSGVSGLLVYGLLGNTAVASVTNVSYGMSLSSYLVSGVAFSSIINNGLGMFNRYASPSQIEEVMVTPISFRRYVLLSSFLGILANVGTAALYFVVSIAIFGLAYSYNIPALLATIALGVASSIGLGFIGLGLQLVYKQTAVLSWLLFSLSGIAGNMIVPVQVLPGSVQTIAFLTPQYYFFTGIRVALGSEVVQQGSLFISFTGYAIVLVLVGMISLNRGLNFIRRQGTHRWM